MPTTFTRFPSPLGELVLTASDTALQGVFFPVRRKRSAPEEQAGWVEDDGPGLAGALLARVRRQLTEYFEGTRTTFDLPLDAAGSAFERRVWDLLRTIPHGATTSYGELARRLGGELTGFGGGLDRKRWLLEHEGVLLMLGRA